MSYCSKRPPPISDVSQPVGYVTTYPSGSRVRNVTYDASPQYFYSRSFSGSKTTGFKRLKKRDLPFNPFSVLTAVVTDSVGSVKRNVTNGTLYEGYGRKTMGTSILAMNNCLTWYWSQNTNSAVDAATNGMLNAMSNMKFNAAQAFAERRQTANLLVNSVNRFVTFAVLFRKGKFSEANKILQGRKRLLYEGTRGPVKFPKDYLKPPSHREFSNLWLEYSYGWRPLVSDVYGAAELLAQAHTGSRPLKAVGYGEKRFVTSSQATSEGLTGKATAEGVSSVRARCFFDISNAALDTLKSTGLSNPLLLAWELIPYSFVVDWFIPVGQYLSAVNATQGLQFKKGGYTIKGVFDVYSASTSNNSTWTLGSSFPCSCHLAQVVRIAYTSFPNASLPSVSLGLNLSQVTSGLALLTQIFKPKR